jgi:hypothetical protein
MGRPAVTAPAVKPEIGLLETTSSYYNGLGVREGMRPIAVELARRGWNFEFLYEQLLGEGLQRLEGTDLLFVPAGICMPPELADAVYAWVRKGGVLFCTGGPAGALDRYGQPSGRLNGIFGAEWTNAEGRWTLGSVATLHAANGVKAWKTRYGKGTVMVFDGIAEEMFDLMPSHVEQRLGSDNPQLHLCMRQEGGTKYLYVLNWSVDRTEEATIFVKGGYGAVVDEGLQLPMKVPHCEKGGKTRFRTRLAPAALALFRIH